MVNSENCDWVVVGGRTAASSKQGDHDGFHSQMTTAFDDPAHDTSNIQQFSQYITWEAYEFIAHSLLC